jgi:hypothetical protein
MAIACDQKLSAIFDLGRVAYSLLGLAAPMKLLERVIAPCVLVTIALFVTPEVAFAQTDEIQVYDAVIAEPNICADSDEISHPQQAHRATDPRFTP